MTSHFGWEIKSTFSYDFKSKIGSFQIGTRLFYMHKQNNVGVPYIMYDVFIGKTKTIKETKYNNQHVIYYI